MGKVVKFKKDLESSPSPLNCLQKITENYCPGLYLPNGQLETIQTNNSDAFIGKAKNFPQFFRAFFKSTSNFEHFQIKITLIAYIFPKLPTPKDVVR